MPSSRARGRRVVVLAVVVLFAGACAGAGKSTQIVPAERVGSAQVLTSQAARARARWPESAEAAAARSRIPAPAVVAAEGTPATSGATPDEEGGPGPERTGASPGDWRVSADERVGRPLERGEASSASPGLVSSPSMASAPDPVPASPGPAGTDSSDRPVRSGSEHRSQGQSWEPPEPQDAGSAPETACGDCSAASTDSLGPGIVVRRIQIGPEERIIVRDNRTHIPAGDRQDRAPPVVTAPRRSEGAAAEPLAATSAAPDGAGASDGGHTTLAGSGALDAHAAGGDRTATADAPGPAGGGAGSLADLLDELVRFAANWNPTGRASIAVVTADGVLHGVNEHRAHVSASAVKALWTAAAIDQAGASAVAPLAHATLAQSDNHAAGSVIDLIGIDAVNTWTRDIAGLAGTQVASWSYGKRRISQSAIDGGGYANLTTAADLARFYALLHGNELLGPDGTVTLLGWLRDTPRGSGSSVTVAGALLSRLPPTVAAEATHKAGWLPPNCCRNDHRLIIDAGGIPLPSGDWFGIAAVADRGQNYNLSIRWVAYAACRVYEMLARNDNHSCNRAGDGPS